MIYKNVRPLPIEVVNPRTGERRIIQPNGITPELPPGLENGEYRGFLAPLFSTPIPQNFQNLLRTNELFETENVQDGFYNVSNPLLENEEKEDGADSVKILNETPKKGRGRPKKS